MLLGARRGSVRVLAASGLCALLLAAGCAEDPEDVGSPAAEPTATPTSSVTPSVAPSATPSETPSTTPSAIPVRGLRGLLPSAAELPGFNPEWIWREVRTGPADTQPFGACSRFDLSSLGAERAVRRIFAPGGPGASPGVSAEALAVRFPDAATAARVQSVLTSWHADCAQRLRASGGFDDLRVRPITQVPTSGAARGSWYLLSWTTPQDGFFHAFGLAARGNRMVLLTMDNPGQDHNYPRGQEPMAKAAAQAAAALG